MLGRALLWLFTVVVVMVMVVEVDSAKCPWEEKGLLLWSDSKTWDKGKVPVDDQEVTIAAGKRVLLDTQPASLATLTIEAGAALIWGDVDGLVLDTHYIHIKGEFHIGSETCRFNQKARIRLHGKTNDIFNVKEEEFGRKFIGVAKGAVLELHGKKKTAWTKLAQTVRRPQDIECAVIYDHADTAKNLIGLERQLGLHVIVWNEDGTVMDYNIFKSGTDMKDFFATIPDGKVIGMFAYGKDGPGTKAKVWEPTIVGLGGANIGKAGKGDSYSFLARKGDPGSAQEFTKAGGQQDPAPSGYLRLFEPSSNLVFQVSSSYSELFQYFRVINAEVAYPILTLVDEVEGWEPGDEILLTSTDFDWKQAERRRIIECGKKCNKRQIRVDNSFEYMHYGNFTMMVDERGEVALLSRNIVLQGVTEDKCYYNDKHEQSLCRYFHRDTFGGHLKIVRGFKSVHIRGVEVTHMGQQRAKGHYPIHFHMVDEAKGMYVMENSIHDTFSRCITVHGTNYLKVADNVCYKHYGHGIFTEDGVEQFNTFTGNLVAGTMYGTLLLSDMSREWCQAYQKQWVINCGGISSYWITHPNNVFSNNVAAGSMGHGYMYVFPDLPLGPSLARQKELGIPHHPKDFPMTFIRNVAHSNYNSGVFVDSKISTGTGMENKGKVPENGILQSENEYDPLFKGKPGWTEMSYGTYYKNGQDNMWIKGGNIRVSYSTMADSPQGFSGGTTLFNSGTEVYRSIFIGETENNGLAQRRIFPRGKEKKMLFFDRAYPGLPTETLSGVGLYQGPNIIRESFFDKYETRWWCLDPEKSVEKCPEQDLLTRLAGAISFKRSNNYPTMTSSYLENNDFGFCDNDDGTQHWVMQGPNGVNDWIWKDGNKAVFVRDKDGALTGTANSAIVPNFPLFNGPECLERPDWGDLLVCPYRYIKMEILGDSGNLASSMQRDYPLIIQRNDAPYDVPFAVKGEIRNEYLLRTYRSYIVDFNDTKKSAGFPKDYKIYGFGVEKGDVVRVGLCQPKDVDSYNIFMDYPAVIRNNATWVDNLDDLDADQTGAAFFHDKKNGILFFKLLSFDKDTNDTQQCPDGKCWKVKIGLNGGSVKKIRSCDGIKIPPFKSKWKPPKKPTPQSCPKKSSPKGLGSVNWKDVGFIVKEEYSVTCPVFDGPAKRKDPEHLGCYLEKYKNGQYQTDLMTVELLELSNSMTVPFCLDRCYYRGYQYAGLSRSRRCTCGNTLQSAKQYVGTDKDCGDKCVGNDGDRCGGKKHLDVWTTGRT